MANVLWSLATTRGVKDAGHAKRGSMPRGGPAEVVTATIVTWRLGWPIRDMDIVLAQT
jgi:hypothetical protein